MRMRAWVRTMGVMVGAAIAAWAPPALACATCFGESDSPMATGMTWGILVLLGVIGVVLAGVLTFFVLVAAKPGTWRDADPAVTPKEGESWNL